MIRDIGRQMTPDEITAICAAAKAKRHAEDAERAAGRVREAVDTFKAVRPGHATPYVARGAAMGVRIRTTRAANHAARDVHHAEYQAEKARRAAKTPQASKFAAEAGESVVVASAHANDALRMAYEVCEEATLDARKACRAYKTD